MQHLTKNVNHPSFFCGIFTLLLLSVASSLHASTTPVYRFWSDGYKSHFYTNSETEKENVLANDPNWCLENVAFKIDKFRSENTVSIHRFWSSNYRSHFYTASETEKSKLITSNPNWTYEGVAFYGYGNNKNRDAIPIYRFWSSNYRSHFYTASETEKSKLITSNPNWTYEGVAFYGYISEKKIDSNCEDNTGNNQDLGPSIAVGLSEYTRDALEDNALTIESTNHDYAIIIREVEGDGSTKDETLIAKVDHDEETEITYDSNGRLNISGPVDADIDGEKEDIIFIAADSSDNNTIIFETNRNSDYDAFRYSLRVRYTDKDDGPTQYRCDNYDENRCIWLINDLPLELYTWGMGEITGTAADIDGKYDKGMEYNKMMATIYRSYGHYKITESTEHKSKGFDTVPDPSDQIYRGYVWEQRYPNIPDAAQETRGKIVTYDGEPILTPFGSWTDGRTRYYTDGHFNSVCRTSENKKESDIFPYLKGVDDSPGKHPSSSTCALAAAGNHMVGISAQGSLNRALDDDWKWERITKHYLSGVDINQQY